MTEQFKTAEAFQKVSKENFDVVLRAWGEAGKGFQNIATEVTNYSKKVFNDATRTFEQLTGARSLEQAIEIQSEYAKRAYDAHVAELSKLGEMYVNVTRSALNSDGGSRFQQGD